MKDVLHTLGNTPVTSSAIASLYPGISGCNQKVALLQKAGDIIRLKRGLYVVSPEISGKRISVELVANHIYTPSYVSMLSALSWYGLIPERVSTIQSMTVKHSRTFINSIANFEYRYIDSACFPIGLRNEEADGASFVIASAEKALFYLVANTSGLNLRYLSEACDYLENDLRFDMDALKDFSLDILRQYVKCGKKPRSIETIIKLLDR